MTTIETATARHTRKAAQLLTASAKHSYDPYLDINWDAPLVPGKWFLPERRCSLYGTSLWDELDLEQRLVLSREEMASSIAMGVWTEHILLQLVARYVYDRDVADPRTQFALTEVADEVRHMIMFAKTVQSMGTTTYAVPWKVRVSGRILKTTAPVPALWSVLLLTEEIFDRIQRENAVDETVQPVIRAMSRIHVVEEARHISFARAELDTFVPTLNRVRLEALRFMLATTIRTFGQELFHPEIYRRAGLNPDVAVPLARANPHNKSLFRFAAERIVGHYREIGLIGGPSERMWRSAGFL